MFARDVRLWSSDQRVGEAIAERLGWLDAPAHFAERIAGLEGFGDAVVDEGYETVVVAGMGGSSLAPDVLGRTFGNLEGYLALRILDSTDPAYVSATLDDLDPLRTLVIIASKSGTTTEPNAFLAYAWARAEAALEQSPTIATRGPAPTSRRSPTRAAAPRPSPTATTSARCSSTRPTSAAATRP